MRKTIFTSICSFAGVVAMVTPTSVYSATSHYERGVELFEMGRWADARVELLEASRSHELRKGGSLTKQNIDYMRAVSSAGLGYSMADSELVAFTQRYPQTPYANHILYDRALMRAEEGDMEGVYELLSDVDPEKLSTEEREQYNIRMGYLTFAQEDHQQALHHFTQIPKTSEIYNHALYYRSFIAYLEEDYASAKSGFLVLQEDDLYKPVIPYYLLQIEFLTHNYDSAIDYGTKLLDVASVEHQGELVRIIAESYFRIRNYRQAIAYIERYVAAGGTMGRTESYLKGFSLHQMKRYKEAIEPLKLACGADDEMTQNSSFHLANCYLHANDKQGALKAFSMASNDKFNVQIAEEALFNQAKLQYELGGGVFNETINLLTRYIERYTNAKRRSVAQSLLAAAYYNSRDYATAYEKIGQIRNPDAEMRAAKQKITYLRGLELFTNGDYESAERCLRESIAIGITAKQVSLAHYWIGEIEYRKSNYSDALDGYNYMVARAPKGDVATVEAYYSIAYALFMQGNYSSALDYFQRFVTSPKSVTHLRADAYNRMGDIYYSMRNFTQASKNYSSSVANGGAEGCYPSYQNAIILGVQGELVAKIKALRKIVDFGTLGAQFLDDAHYELGGSYIKNGEYVKAIETLESFIERYPRSPLYAQTLSDLGVASINAKDSKGALDYYDRAIKAAPQSQIAKNAMQGIREIYVGQGDAQAYFKYAESIGMEGDLNTVMRDSLSFASARGLYFTSEAGEGKQRSAANALGGYIKGYPNGYYLSDALFYLSDCYIKLGEDKSAISTLVALEQRGQSQYSERVYKMLLKLTYEAKMYGESANAARKLFDVAKDQETRYEAMSHYATTTIESGDSENILAMSDEIISIGESRVGAQATTEAIYIKASNQRERGERSAALELYKELAARPSAAKYRGESNYYIIDDRYRAGDVDGAERLIFEFADSDSPDAYWLAKSFILLGDIYVGQGDNFQARATYQSIVDGYATTDDGVIEMATQKIGELK